MLFEPGNLPKGPRLQTKKALLLIDLQNDFVTSTGKLPVPNTAEFLSKLPTLTAKFREKGPVVWINTTFRQPCPTVSTQTGCYSIILKSLVEHLKQQPHGNASTNAGLGHEDHESVAGSVLPSDLEDDAEAFLAPGTPQAQRCCLLNAHGSGTPPSIASSVDRQSDIVFGKSEYSAFADFSLVMQLRARMVNDLYICGSLSNVGVYATVLDAVQQGFGVTLVEDCLGFRNETCHIEAMKRMADDFCAQGIDYQELMDDLCGLLGDVIPASRYTRKFQLSQHISGTQPSHSQKVQSWMETIHSDSEAEISQPTVEAAEEPDLTLASKRSLASPTAPDYRDSAIPPQLPQDSSKNSPPRKRSTSDRDEAADNHSQRSRTSQAVEGFLQSPAALFNQKQSGVKKSKIEATVREVTPKSTRPRSLQPPSPPRNFGHSAPTGHIKASPQAVRDPQSGERTMSQPNISTSKSDTTISKTGRKKPKYNPSYLGPSDRIGSGDTRIIHDVLPQQEADDHYFRLKKEVAWQKMCHRTGEVPRLVAVQGTVEPDGTIPIYRHPADESPPLLSFDKTVDTLRRDCEKLVGHKLNHVLIQYYRNGEDNISEHSDKSLDIVRGSSIVNLSLGAMRTMTLRKKKVSQLRISDSKQDGDSSLDGAPRTAQRIRLPHNSLFILGEVTNTNWLHSIRADKRPNGEKLGEELAFESERISLTFRHIGTFVNLQKQLIWGQGATAKTKTEAKAILQGDEASQKGEEMIIGFGQENQLNDEHFNWQAVYGAGFDVVNFKVMAANG